jgi:TonB family protein
VRRIAIAAATPTASVQFNNARREDMKGFMVNRSPQESDALRAALWAMEDAAFRAVEQWRYDPPADGPISFPMIVNFALDGEVTTARGRGRSGGSAGTIIRDQIQAPPGAVRVGGNIRTPTKIVDVRPVYPPIAQSARVRGMVIAEVLVGTDGTVRDAKILRSIPLLDQAALDAVRQWQFTPTLLNGQAVPVIMTVTVNFTLQDGNDVETPREVEPEGLRPTASARTRSWAPELVKDVKPSYTAEALRAGIEGNVEIEAVIGTNGTVTSTRVVKGHPMLNDSATAAVQQWLFKPIPEPFTATIELTFRTRK